MNALSGYLLDFLSLFFPELCPACGNNLLKNENIFCTGCIYHFPYTGFNTDKANPVVRQLWGRFPFVHADAFLYFNKGGKVQNMLHELKYNNRPEAGFRIGELYGYHLKENGDWEPPDLIIPVPLHPRKLKQRGYNQAEHIAKGIASVTNIPVATGLLIRRLPTETQTSRSRYSRYENMKDAFEVTGKDQVRNTHILLVDDVVTTGATLEACAAALLEGEGVQISISAIAFTE